jgi:hypothetical protein
MNKNTRLAKQIERLEESINDMLTTFSIIRNILLKKESIPAAIESDQVSHYNDDENEPLCPVSLSNSTFFKEIFQNSTTVFYKRLLGTHRGSIVTVNKKDNTFTDHRYFVSTRLDKQLCLVSKDQDGIDYLNNVVRPSISFRVNSWNKTLKFNKIGNQLVRYYRPGNSTKVFTHHRQTPTKNHAAVYLKDRNQMV